MYLEIAAALYMVGDFIYHRIQNGDWPFPAQTPPNNPAQEITTPRTDPGAPYPLLYGRCRVKAPILAWTNTVSVFDGPGEGATSPFVYAIDMHFVLGIPPAEGSILLHNVFTGERTLDLSIASPPTNAFGAPNYFAGGFTQSTDDSRMVGGYYEVLEGRSDQLVVDGGGVATTILGHQMLEAGVVAGQIPSYRGFASVFLHDNPAADTMNLEHGKWITGVAPQIQAYGFEISARPAGLGSGPIGDDLNPVDVVYDILVEKLGISTAKLDMASLTAAASTLRDEAHGFSRSWEARTTAIDALQEILMQIDAVLFSNPTTGLISLKLIRPDYDPLAILGISPDNCIELQNFAGGSWTDVANKVTVTYTDRENGYQTNTAKAQNQGNAVGQDGQTSEVQLMMPGVCTRELAQAIAARELEARSRPIMKCRAKVYPMFLRVLPGDAVMLTWPRFGISRVVFRVAAVNRGTLENGAITLDLIQDYFYQWRRVRPAPPFTTVIGSIGG